MTAFSSWHQSTQTRIGQVSSGPSHADGRCRFHSLCTCAALGDLTAANVMSTDTTQMGAPDPTHARQLCCAPQNLQGTVKGLTSDQLQELDCHIILGNTYHLGNHPGHELVDSMGGLHGFINWPRGMLTDSGGFQMVSLLHLADITERGVEFQSPIDGSRMLLTPEESMAIQNGLGADIIMQVRWGGNVARAAVCNTSLRVCMCKCTARELPPVVPPRG